MVIDEPSVNAFPSDGEFTETVGGLYSINSMSRLLDAVFPAAS